MKKHNPNRVAVAVLVAGAVLAGVVIQGPEDSGREAQTLAETTSARKGSAGGGSGRDAPTLAEIPSALEGPAGEGEVLRVYSVSGMCCDSCTRKLHDQVLGMEGIEACAVDLTDGRVHLIAKGAVPPGEILAKLNFEKYSAVELPLGP